MLAVHFSGKPKSKPEDKEDPNESDSSSIYGSLSEEAIQVGEYDILMPDGSI